MQGRITLQKRFEYGKGVWQISVDPRLPNRQPHVIAGRHQEAYSVKSVLHDRIRVMLEVVSG